MLLPAFHIREPNYLSEPLKIQSSQKSHRKSNRHRDTKRGPYPHPTPPATQEAQGDACEKKDRDGRISYSDYGAIFLQSEAGDEFVLHLSHF